MHGWLLYLVIAVLAFGGGGLFAFCACELAGRADDHLANPREGER